MPQMIFDVLITPQTTEAVAQLSGYLFREEHLDGPLYTENGEPAGGFAQQGPSLSRPGYTRCWLWGSAVNLGKLKAGEQEPLAYWAEDVV